jgi:hypothetical protein
LAAANDLRAVVVSSTLATDVANFNHSRDERSGFARHGGRADDGRTRRRCRNWCWPGRTNIPDCGISYTIADTTAQWD